MAKKKKKKKKKCNERLTLCNKVIYHAFLAAVSIYKCIITLFRVAANIILLAFVYIFVLTCVITLYKTI